MSGKDQALKDWEKTKQREEYWEKIFGKMREEKKEEEESHSLTNKKVAIKQLG